MAEREAFEAYVRERWEPLLRTATTVHRSPFLTQSVALIRYRRSLVRVMTCSPT